jgi:type II secretory pathway pseudopilin PulG
MKNEKGYTLIGTIIALALLGVIAVAFLGALVTASNALIITDKHATAESLARSQMEYVKSQGYDAYNNPPQYALITNIPADYSIVVSAARLDRGQGTTIDTGIQKITVTIYHPAEEIEGNKVITLEDYKVNR